MYKLLQNYDRQNLKPLKLFTKSPSELLFQEKSSYRLHHLDCATGNPCLKKETTIGAGVQLKDMCLVTKNEGEVLICLFDGADGIYARNQLNQLLWSVEGAMVGRKKSDVYQSQQMGLVICLCVIELMNAFSCSPQMGCT